MNIKQFESLASIYKKRAPLLDAINVAAPWHSIYRKRTVERIKKLINKKSRVLDLACGTGILAKDYAELVASTVLVDCLPQMVKIANENIKNIEADISVLNSSIINVEAYLSDQEFDLIILTQSLNFIEDPNEVFSLAKNRLSANGTLYLDIDNSLRWAIIETFNDRVDNALSIVKNGKDLQKNIIGTDYFFYNKDDLIKIAEFNGLKLSREIGICHVSCLLHIFNQSSDFLEESLIDSRVEKFTQPENFNKLLELDIEFESSHPPESGGWLVLEFNRI